jgi:hypothetical protein
MLTKHAFLVDGTICSGEGWIGFNGNCYKFFLKRQTSHHETCRDNDAVQTSLTTVEEYNTIVEYIRSMPFLSLIDSSIFSCS